MNPILVVLAICFVGWALLKLAHMLGLPGLHTWTFSHESDEQFVGVRARRWVTKRRTVSHYRCRFCDTWRSW